MENPIKNGEAVEHDQEALVEKIYDEVSVQKKKDPANPEKETPLLEGVAPERVKRVIQESLARMDSFIEAADRDEATGLKIDKETAEKIGAIWIYSGVGTYDLPYKPNDNPRLRKSFMAGTNRERIDHTVLLARRIAEARSGKRLPLKKGGSKEERKAYTEAMKEMMAEFAPYIVFGGHENENQDIEEVLERDGIIIPQEKVSIIRRKDGEKMYSTADQVEHFISPEEVRDKEVAFVSNDIHLNRILLILKKIIEKYPDHLPQGKPVHLFPTPTMPSGREEFKYMEASNIIRYIYDFKRAAEEPYPYTLER